MIRLIVFDFDGTLGDTRANIMMTMQGAMQALDLPEADEASIAATIGLPLEEGFRQLFPQLSDEEITRCAAVYREIFERNRGKLKPQLFPGVKETLAALKRKGIVLTVASSRSSKSLNGFLDEMGIAEYISYSLGADQVLRAKPDPEPVLQTLRELKMDAGETLVVGDMPVDILMGRRAGARTCAVTWGNADREALAKAAPDLIIDDITTLLQI